jgi:signal transduction histidine kinase
MRGPKEVGGGTESAAEQDLSRALLGVETIEAVAEHAVRHIRRSLDCTHVSIVVFDPEAAQATVVAAFSSTATKGGGGSRWPLDAFGSLDGGPASGLQFVPDLRAVSPLPPAIGAMARTGVRSLLAVPLIVSDERIGSLLVGCAEANAFQVVDLQFLSSAAEMLGQALRRAKRLESLLEQAVALERRIEDLERSRAEHRTLMAQVALAQEQERQRIAVDIHDDSIQVMSTAALRLHSLRKQIDNDRLEGIAGEVEDTIRLAVRRLRHLMFELIPATLDRDGLGAAIAVYLNKVSETYDLESRVEDRLTRQPPADVRVILYRVAQEAVMNVVKHARATEIVAVIDEHDDGFSVVVRDDGVGFSIDDVEGRLPMHLGLTAMRQRAEMAGGWCRIHSLSGSGTTVEAWVPGKPVGAAVDPGARAHTG